MTFLKRVLDPPSYGYLRDGTLYVPSKQEIFGEFFRRLNVFSTRKNWLPLLGWTATLCLVGFFIVFLVHYASFLLMAIGFLYGMVFLGSHGTFWFHRYGAHRAFRFRNSWIRTLCRNLAIKIIPDEIYVISHHVHHQFSEQPGDPYNVHAGWLYCFLADVNHQTIRKDLSEQDYARLCSLMRHMGVHLNTYSQYKYWGSLCHPVYTIVHYVLNWSFWYGILYLAGGPALATAIFGWAGIWAIGIRTFNYEGHGKGKDLRRDGIDFNRADLSVNQIWPGFVAGEWHNNHHLYASGARSGFLPYQLDLPWLWIRFLAWVGAITSYKDYKSEFLEKYYLPWLASKRNQLEPRSLDERKSEQSVGSLPLSGGQLPQVALEEHSVLGGSLDC